MNNNVVNFTINLNGNAYDGVISFVSYNFLYVKNSLYHWEQPRCLAY